MYCHPLSGIPKGLIPVGVPLKILKVNNIIFKKKQNYVREYNLWNDRIIFLTSEDSNLIMTTKLCQDQD